MTGGEQSRGGATGKGELKASARQGLVAALLVDLILRVAGCARRV